MRYQPKVDCQSEEVCLLDQSKPCIIGLRKCCKVHLTYDELCMTRDAELIYWCIPSIVLALPLHREYLPLKVLKNEMKNPFSGDTDKV